MDLGWNEIRSRAIQFAYEWQGQGYEKGQSQSFWIEFFNVFGVSQKRVTTFEKKVKKIDGKDGFIDLLWKGVLLIEQKSVGKDLERAYKQARDYFHGLTDDELPRYVLVCNFAQFRLYDLMENTDIKFSLGDFPSKVELFGFMIGMAYKIDKNDEKVSTIAAEKMAMIHDRLKVIGYTGRDLEQYLVRLLFCLFADDTSIFDKNIFRDYIARTNIDGNDLAPALDMLFYVLNTPEEKRLATLDERLRAFPYVNGGLFADRLTPAAFDSSMRKTLLECSMFDWGFISPSIFGSMFQAAMSPEHRRELGAHYTEESNILKVVNPLFMNELREGFRLVKSNKKKLEAFHEKLAGLKFMDPACGTGNFLIIAYREIRRLELDVLRAIYMVESASIGSTIQMTSNIEMRAKINVDQFYGIEIDEFACEIAKVGMWLMDHQCNMDLSREMGQYYIRLPLVKSAIIVHGNSLRIDWQDICPSYQLNYILGNPPFCGARLMNADQKQDMISVFMDNKGKAIKGAGNLDYVAAWYYKAAGYMLMGKIQAAFVSTNSITQGEQVALLWGSLLNELYIVINFAYRTFVWTSAARGKAAVHCVIIGFSRMASMQPKQIFEGDTITIAKNISPYLVDASNVIVKSRSKPICNVLAMSFGNMPNDAGYFLFEKQEKDAFILNEPESKKWFKPFMGADNYINKTERWCLWLKDITPSELKNLPEVRKRVESVQKIRLASVRESTRKLGYTPALFGEIRQPIDSYIIIPRHSSENRKYIPIGFLPDTVIPADSSLIIPNATLYHFGVLTSNIHMAWVRVVCGRLKSDYRYSSGVVYNNFPWPDATDKQKEAIENAAQGVLDARAAFPNESLANLYDPNLMPPELVKAHNKLDAVVKAAYGGKGFASESERVVFLMERYAELVKNESKK